MPHLSAHSRSLSLRTRTLASFAPAGLFAGSALLLLAAPALSDGPRWRPLPGAAERSRAARMPCPPDATLVTGRFCRDAEENCLEWSTDGRERCLRFESPTHCRSAERTRMAFCMDRYEWPNRPGAHPDVMVTHAEAESLCRGRSRRLCTESEWTFACEGEEIRPYPYGYVRDASACTIDHRARAPNKILLHNPLTAMEEAVRVYEASPSGSMPACRSPFDVMDMTGNVDEWVVNETGVPFRSSLMGGFWGHVRTRCRAVTRGHNESFRYYQIGFRCCDDVAR